MIDEPGNSGVGRRASTKPANRVKKVCLFGNFGTLNMGNEVTLQALIHNIRRVAPSVDVSCACSYPEDVLARHHVVAFPMSHRLAWKRRHGDSPFRNSFGIRALRILFVRIPSEIVDWFKAFSFLKSQQVLVMAGTGMLTDCGQGVLGLPYEIFKWTLAAKIRGLRLVFLSVGVEPMQRSLTRFFVRYSLSLSDYVCFRDRHSQEHVNRIGFAGKSVIFPDLAFSLPAHLLPKTKARTHEKRFVGVGLFNYAGGGTNGVENKRRYADYLQNLSGFISWLIASGYSVRVLIGDIQYDPPVRIDLQMSLKKLGILYQDHTIIDEPISSVDELLRQIEETDVVVATRYHNVALALMLNKPIISLSYEYKNEALMENVGLSDYCQDLDHLDLERLKAQFVALERNAGDLKALIRERMEEFRKTLVEQYSAVFNWTE